MSTTSLSHRVTDDALPKDIPLATRRDSLLSLHSAKSTTILESEEEEEEEQEDYEETRRSLPRSRNKQKPRVPTAQDAIVSQIGRGPVLLGVPPPTVTKKVRTTLRVLVVEDNPINQKTAVKMVKLLGYEAQTANNGVEAMEKLQRSNMNDSAETPFDVILMDLHMPMMDGFQTTTAIKTALPEDKRPTIISVTASESAEESLKCLALGMAFYIAKPIIMGELSNLLLKCKMIGDTKSVPQTSTPTHRANNLHGNMHGGNPPASANRRGSMSSLRRQSSQVNVILDEDMADDENASITAVTDISSKLDHSSNSLTGFTHQHSNSDTTRNSRHNTSGTLPLMPNDDYISDPIASRKLSDQHSDDDGRSRRESAGVSIQPKHNAGGGNSPEPNTEVHSPKKSDKCIIF